MRVSEEHFGMTGKCPKCGSPLTITPPVLETAAPSVATPLGPDIEAEAAAPAEWAPGDIILNLYEVGEVLGEGGMGKVFRVHHRQWDLDLAVKCPRPEILRRSYGIEFVERECETWINLGLHPHVVSCYYVRRLANIPRVFMEYVEGGSLSSWIRDGRLYEGGPARALERILRAGIQIAWGLHHAHTQGLVHRDVKTTNVLMTKEGIAKVTDFGLMRAREAANGGEEKAPSEGSGKLPKGMTPLFCSPEQYIGHAVTHKSDLYSWAVAMVEMFTRKIVWRVGTEVPAVLQSYLRQTPGDPRLVKMPSSLGTLLEACLQKDPAVRPQSLMDVSASLAQIYKQTIGISYPETPPKPVDVVSSTLNNRAVSLLDLGKPGEAEALLTKALQEDAYHPETTYNLNLLRWRQGLISDVTVVQKLSEVCQHHAEDWLPYYLMGQVHLERGDMLSASQILEHKSASAADHEPVARCLRLSRQHLGTSRRLVRVFEGHADGVNTVCLVGDGEFILSASEDNTLRLWELSTGQCVQILKGHSGSVEAVALAGGMMQVLSVSRDRSVKFWDVTSGRCIRSVRFHREPVKSVAVLPNGRQALSRWTDNALALWEVEDAEVTRAFAGHTDSVSAVAMSPAGRFALTSSHDGTLRYWDVDSGRCLKVFKGHMGPVEHVVLTTDGTFALSGSADRSLRLWDMSSGHCIRVMNGHTDAVLSVAFCPETQLAVSGSADHSVRLWDLESGRCLCTFPAHSDEVRSVAVTPDGKYAVSCSRDKTIKLWDLAVQAPTYQAPPIVCQAIRSEAALSVGVTFKQLLTAAHQLIDQGDALRGAAALRKARALPGYARRQEAILEWGRLYRRLRRNVLAGAWEGHAFEGHEAAITSLQVAADGRFCVSGAQDGSIKVWSVSSGKCVRSLRNRNGAVSAVACSADGRFALSGGEDSIVQLWDCARSECVQTFEGFTGIIQTLAMSPDSRFVVTGGLDIVVWDVETGYSLHSLEGHQSDVLSLCFSADGTLLLSGSSDETLILWEVASGKRLLTFAGHAGGVPACAISEDGRIAVSGTNNMWGRAGELFVWDFNTGEHLHTFEGHTGSLTSVCMTSDGRHVFSGSVDETVRVWDTATGECLRTLRGHQAPVTAASVTRDGRFALSGDASGRLFQWILDWGLDDVAPEEWDDAARPYLETFLTLKTPYAGRISEEGPQSDQEILMALSHRGKPEWTEEDIQTLLYTLGSAGFGHLTKAGIEAQLERLVAKRKWTSMFPLSWGRKRS